MITGTVTRHGREAVIPLTLPGDSDREDILIQAVIDTGFTDRLTLPPEIVEELELPLRGAVEAILADGSVETLPLYTGCGYSGTVRSMTSALTQLPVTRLRAWRYSPEASSV